MIYVHYLIHMCKVEKTVGETVPAESQLWQLRTLVTAYRCIIVSYIIHILNKISSGLYFLKQMAFICNLDTLKII